MLFRLAYHSSAGVEMSAPQAPEGRAPWKATAQCLRMWCFAVSDVERRRDWSILLVEGSRTHGERGGDGPLLLCVLYLGSASNSLHRQGFVRDEGSMVLWVTNISSHYPYFVCALEVPVVSLV